MSKPTRPQPPLVYRPQPPPKVLQPKAVAPHAKKTLAAPPVYRPQPAPKVLQRKAVEPPQRPTSNASNRSRVYRP